MFQQNHRQSAGLMAFAAQVNLMVIFAKKSVDEAMIELIITGRRARDGHITNWSDLSASRHLLVVFFLKLNFLLLQATLQPSSSKAQRA